MKASLLCIMILILGGCVSVELGGGKVTHATGVRFTNPGGGFQKASAENVDQIWRNPKNGNAISYLSECGDNSDPTLQSVEQGVLSGLYPYSYESQKDITYENRAARRVSVKGVVDGVSTLVDLLTFKRNNCLYILSYVGLEQYHRDDLKAFEEFIKGFHAP